MKKFIIVITFVILVLIYPSINKHKVISDKAIKGTMNLNKYNFVKNGTVKLDGELELYNNKLLNPEQIKDAKTNRYLIIPSKLKTQLNGETTGYMTLRLRIYAPSNTVYGLRIEQMLSASKVWVNGILQSQVGKVGKSYNSEKAIYLPTYSYFNSKDGVIDIVIETSNYTNLFPTIKSMDFGLKDQIMNKFVLNSGVDLMILGSLFIIGGLFLFFYLSLKNNKSFLYFSAMCILAELRCLFLNERLIVHFFPNMPFELLSKTAAITYYLFIPVYVLFLKGIFKNLSRKIVTLSLTFSAVFTTICLTTNNTFYDRLSYLSEAILAVIVLYLLIFLIKSFINRYENSGVSLLALIFLIITAINDILLNNGFLYSKYGFQIGMLIFSFLETYVLITNYCDDLLHLERLKIENQIIYNKSIRDNLTNLYNRNYLDEILDVLMEKYINKNETFSVIMFDIDFFKSVNDNYGHLYGDKVLIAVSNTLNTNITDNCYACRYGGEEFVVILSNTVKQKAKTIAEKIRKSVSELSFENGIKVTVSGGVYENNTTTKYECIKKADKLLYNAKRLGRNRIEA
ncbi:MAG: GGDEF domain-containing protein [Clostridium sp.]|nr:GGDEF domain-containing protein [Clostridium sp.]